MYYNRLLTDDFGQLSAEGGPLRWMFDYVKSHRDLDFQVGRNDQKQWISIYRGLTRLVTVRPSRKSQELTVDAAPCYKAVSPELFGRKSISDLGLEPIEKIRQYLEEQGSKDRHYGNKREGYYQNELSRMYGICGSSDSGFVVVDKEAVVGYKDTDERNMLLGPLQDQYKELLGKLIKKNPKRYGSKLGSLGNELDFLAVDQGGNILLVEYKHHGSEIKGIYRSPLQIGLYYEIFSSPQLRSRLQESVLAMLVQKQEMGLVNAEWKKPELSGKIIPVLIVSEPKAESSAYKKLYEVLTFCREERGKSFLEDLIMYGYRSEEGLTTLPN